MATFMDDLAMMRGPAPEVYTLTVRYVVAETVQVEAHSREEAAQVALDGGGVLVEKRKTEFEVVC